LFFCMRSKQRKYRILSFLAYLASTESIVYFRGKRLFELLPPQKVSAVRRCADSIPLHFRLHLRPLNLKEGDEIHRNTNSHKKIPPVQFVVTNLSTKIEGYHKQ